MAIVGLPAALTGVAALAGLLGAGTELPCGTVCSAGSTDPSAEAWLIAFSYVGIVAVVCFGRLMGEVESDSGTVPTYRGSLGALGAASLVLAIVTPGSWQPLRPALMVGGLSSLAFLMASGRLVAVGRVPPHDDTSRRGRESRAGQANPLE